MRKTIWLALLTVASIWAGPVTYDLTITMTDGPLTGQTGSGTIVLDPTLAVSSGGFVYVDPADGLSVFSITFLTQPLTMSDIVG